MLEGNLGLDEHTEPDTRPGGRPRRSYGISYRDYCHRFRDFLLAEPEGTHRRPEAEQSGLGVGQRVGRPAWGRGAVVEIIPGSGKADVDPTGYLTNVAAIGAGLTHSLAAKGDGTVWAWGNNVYGKLGDGTTTTRLTAVQVTGFTDAIAVDGGEFHSMTLKSNGTVWAWGANGYGQLGDETWISKTHRSRQRD